MVCIFVLIPADLHIKGSKLPSVILQTAIDHRQKYLRSDLEYKPGSLWRKL